MKLQPSSLFGCFAFSRSLKCDVHYFVMNKIIAEVWAKDRPGTTKSALLVISHINNLVKSIDSKILAAKHEEINEVKATVDEVSTEVKTIEERSMQKV